MYIMPTGVTIDQTVSGLTPQGLSTMLAAMSPEAVTLFAPRFFIMNSLEIYQYLVNNGAGQILDQRSADFSAISHSAEFYPNSMAYNAKILFAPTGITAGSVNSVSFWTPVTPTTAGIGITSQGPLPMCPPWNLAANEFTLAQPFLFIIRDHGTGTLIYMGQYNGLEHPAYCQR